MKPTLTLLALLGAAWGWAPQRAQAQCHFVYVPSAQHARCHHDSCAVEKPLVPGRWAGSMGLLGLSDRRGTPYVGGELQAYYWLRPRWSMGLRGTTTAEMPATSAPELYPGASQPRLLLYSVTWNNQLLLSDGRVWRLVLEVGAGLGGVNLYDKAQQVPTKGSCGCTEAEKIASSTAPVTEVGLAATYKLKGKEAPWLTVRGGYRQWNGTVPFGTFNQFSAYTVSVGVSLPDAPAKRK